MEDIINNIPEEDILCMANNYERKYYINPRFSSLPEGVKKELNIISVLFTTRIGGIITMYFDADEKELMISTYHNEEDILYDEIGSGLEIKRLRKENADLFEGLELYYKTMILKEI